MPKTDPEQENEIWNHFVNKKFIYLFILIYFPPLIKNNPIKFEKKKGTSVRLVIPISQVPMIVYIAREQKLAVVQLRWQKNRKLASR